MFKYFLKLFLLFTLSFTHFLYADGADIQISVSNATAVNENTGTATFSISLSEEADWCNVVIVNYSTQNGTAIAGSDYTTKNGTVTFYGECDSPNQVASSTTQTVSITILDDMDYESSEYFYLNISNSTTGYQVSDSSGYVYIYDNDTQALKLDNFADKGVTETDSDQILSMVAYFNQNIPSALTLTYHTEDDTALAGTDYVSSSGTINVLANANNVVIPITIKGDTIPESLKKFKVIIDSISSGTITDNEAYAYINDDDGIKVDISSSDILEGNTGDSNQMEFKIFLTKNYPSTTPLTIDYTTQDGSSPSATVGSDYTSKSGSVTFNLGEKEKTVYVPIIGDDTIEPDENLEMFISGSSYIIDNASESEILNDDGNYPAVDFSSADVSIVEGNTSTKILNFHYTLDNDAIAGSSFEYYTQDDDAKTSDNDYQEITTTVYTIPEGTRDIDIAVTINGDTKIENDETFYLKFQNENNIVIHGHTAKGNIINDDGTYPELSFNLNSFSLVEGNSGQKDLNFTLQLDQPALAGSSFDYKTEDDSAQTSNNDYIQINNKTHTFLGGERSLSIPVKIKGDSNVESNEEFYFKIFNASEDLKLTSSILSVKGQILNDDTAPSAIRNIGEFKFDDCGNEEWKIDSSSIGNNAINGSPTVVQNDDKAYMCTSLNGLSGVATIPHNTAYQVNEGTFSMLLYDHHNIWSSNSWMFQKGALKVEVIRAGGDANQGSIKVHLDGNVINTQEVFFTNSDGGDLDTQWVHVTISFGSKGMKLYINGIEKGTHTYTGGLSSNTDNFSLATLSGYYDEFYLFEGQMSNIQIDQMYQNTINDRNLDGSTRDCGCYVPSDPFTCDSSMYISSSTNRETSATGKMWLHRINTTENPFEFEVMEDTGASELYNATAYNPDDNYIYGLYHRELIRLSRGAEVTNLGEITALPSRFNSKQLYAGAIHGGFYYVSGRNSLSDQLFKINLSDLSVTIVTLSEGVALQDFSFYKNVNDAIPEGQFLYGVEKGGKLTKIDISNGNITRIGSDHSGYEFDSSFSDKNGRFFANDSNGNGFFEFDLITGIKNLVSNSQSATFNDGANCINAALVFNDYGDAPASYGTPKHNLANGIFMGDNIDHDVYTFNTPDANGDDLDGVDDEDGITLADGSDLNGTFFGLDAVHGLKVKVSKNGYFNAWVDFNIDGDFDDAGEKIFTAMALTTGTHSFSINIPNGLTTNTTTYMRFRYSSTPNLSSTEVATDGEVEDYAIQFGSDALRGVFNIERTDSSSYTIDSDVRNAWYTQIVGRDFDYSIVFYDETMTTLQEMDDISVQLELVDMDTNTSLYQRSAHIVNVPPISRLNITLPANDLAQLPATKNARFRITYGVDIEGNIIQANCLSTPALCTLTRTDYARDNFAIRPESFYVSIADNNTILKENSSALPSILRVASGYDYNLSIKATPYPNANHDASLGYDASLEQLLEFNPSGTSNCNDESNVSSNISFSDGAFNDLNFTHSNVGAYALKIKDSTWTTVDTNKTVPDCIQDSSTVSATPNQLSGCHIDAISNMNLSFYPYQFNIDFNINNLPNSGHDDFLYMSSLNLIEHNTSLQFQGSITAQTEDNSTTTNFTRGCVATNVVLLPSAIVETEDGILAPNTNIQTSEQSIKVPTRVDVNLSRMTLFNNEIVNNSHFSQLIDINAPINIEASKFLDENNGTVFLDLRYNINKHLSRTINPVQIRFQDLTVNAPLSSSNANNLLNPNFIPSGRKDLNSTNKNFYFTKVSPDRENYQKLYFSTRPLIRTPLSIDIFCDKSIAYCEQTRVRSNTDGDALSRVQNGWYISTNHDTNSDGIVQNLNATPTVDVIVTPDNNVSFTLGRNGLITTAFTSCNSANDIVMVTIVPDTPLLYHDSPTRNGQPFYTVSCSDQNASQLSGVGMSGNILDNNSTQQNINKIDW